ncbi:NACHT domain-containing protein [Acrocarpospora sp. B8E8]|uniref:NACHT domain-containing protein n=1 Tax=Acrocarpospora sp. B8E8 TaxID=3153572 RepID=UPI00325ED3FC
MPADSVSSLLSYGLAAVALVVVVWLVEKFTGGMIEELGKHAVDRLLAGRRRGLFSRARLKMYAASIRDRYGAHTLGFRRDDAPIAVEDVYVPVRYQSDGGRLDLQEHLRETNRAVLVGEPGAGKSILLKHLMLQWARRPRRDRPIPVLVELYRYGTGGATLKDLIARALSHGKWQSTVKDLDVALGKGRLRLYFDGLDEVLRDRHAAALADLRDLAGQYGGCPIVVTCRDEVYNGELAAELGQPVKVADFDDAALRLLLRHLLKDDERMATLVAALQANPQVLGLARSPMLLTMIAFLHLEKVFGERAEHMPRSRSEFYEKAIDYLLRRDDARGRGDVTRHTPALKLAILCKAALTLMSREERDRKAIVRRDLLAVIRTEADDFHLDRADADGVIREIVERSRLLIALPGAEEPHVFAHLTLQEYLAALEQGTDWTRLLARYRRHPETWREVVRLWCGLGAADATPLLRSIYAEEGEDGKVLVVHCLAEAAQVADAFADDVVGRFLGQLTSGAALTDSTVRALGVLAGAGGPRGEAVFEELVRVVELMPEDRTVIGARHQAMRTLAATGHPRAAQLLARFARFDDFARAQLRGMGQLALPTLRGPAERGQRWAIDEIGQIGTPAAAEALVALLGREAVAVYAAWWLAALLDSADVWAVLEKDRREDVVPGERLDWVAGPYRREWPARLASVVGRVAWLVDGGAQDTAPEVPSIAPLIALPLYAAGMERRSGRGGWWRRLGARAREGMRALGDRLPPSLDDLYELLGPPAFDRLYGKLEDVGLWGILPTDYVPDASEERTLNRIVDAGADGRLLAALDRDVRLELVTSFVVRPGTRQDWEELAEGTPEPRALRWIRNIVWGALACWVVIVGLLGVWRQGSWVVGAAVALTGFCAVFIFLDKIGSGFEGFTVLRRTIVPQLLIAGPVAVAGLTVYAATATVAAYGAWMGWTVVAAAAAAAVLLGRAVSAGTRRSRNPFQAVLARSAPHLLPAREES